MPEPSFPAALPRPALVVFDMDGVLVDVSASYRPAIAATVRDYFSLVLGLPNPPADLITPEELELLKRAGGLNNDWDMAAAGIAYFLTFLPPVAPLPVVAAGMSTEASVASLRSALGGLSIDWPLVLRTKRIAALAQEAAQHGGGLQGVAEAAGPSNRGLLSYQGGLRDSDLVTRLFQERYLGHKLFQATYGVPPRFLPEEPGLCRQERLMIAPETLRRLAERFPLGIATGRPRAEALFALDLFGVRDAFRCVVTDDDALAAEEQVQRETGRRPNYRKPDPYIVLTALAGLGSPDEPGMYVGDTPDDMRTARAAGLVRPVVLAAGYCALSQDPSEMQQALAAAGADFIVDDLEELARWMLG